MKNYELTVLYHPDLEMNLEPALNKVQKIIEDAGGKIVSSNNDGKKRLAYAIANQTFANYYFYALDLPASAPAKISSVLNITDEVIRYLLVAVDERKAKYEAARKAREEKREKTEE